MLGICNGFQILTEAGLLPGALRPNASLSFVCRDVALTVDRDRHAVHRALHRRGDADDPRQARRGLLVRRPGAARGARGERPDPAPLRARREPERRGRRRGRRLNEHGQRVRADAASGARRRSAARLDRRRADSRLARRRGSVVGRGNRLDITSAKAERVRERGCLDEGGAQALDVTARSVTGPRRATPPVEYAKRTRRSPRASSSNSTTDEKRFSPARCGTASRSTSVAVPQGVAVVVMERP